MNNPKTSIPGWLLLVASVLTLAAHAWSGSIGASDFPTILTALTGVGLIGSKDGGH